MTLRCLYLLPLSLVLACSGETSDDTGNSSAGTESDTSSTTSAGTDGSSSGTTGATTTDTATATTTAGTTSDTATTGGGATGTWEFRFMDYPVPTAETSYKCFEFTVPVDELKHVTGFTPVIDNAPYVHHYVVGMLSGPSGKPQGYDCYDLDGSLVWVWTPGVNNYEFPPEAGLLVGDKGSEVTFRIQVHYDNPIGKTGETDNSGLDIHYTNELRDNNAGSFVVADIDNILIPAGEPAHEHETKCSAQLTNAILSGPIHVFGSSLHAHEIGDKLFAEHWKGGQLVETFNADDPYGFENQNFKDVSLDIAPGDEIITRCIYDASARTEDTVGGIGTKDEMCWNTLTYYPRENVAFDFCGGG